MKKNQQLLIIFGPEAVGKMTVGREIQKQLNYTVFHDHQCIEFVKNYFSENEENFFPLLAKIRSQVFYEIAASYTPGFVLTYVWDLLEASDQHFIDNVITIFKEKLWEVKFIELEASMATRLRRNQMKDRITEKPTFIDINLSEALLMDMEDLKLNSDDDFIYKDHKYLKINNTNLSATETANMVINHFDLFNIPINQ